MSKYQITEYEHGFELGKWEPKVFLNVFVYGLDYKVICFGKTLDKIKKIKRQLELVDGIIIE